MSVEGKNDSMQVEFYIMAFSVSTLGRILLFCGILLAYILVITGNLLILLLVNLVSRLQTPMYFFLCNLSLLDILYVSTIIPELLYFLYTDDNKVLFSVCMFQLYLYLFFADSESFLLTAMAFDRYVAICLPLHYSRIMSKNICVLLAFFAWFVSAVNAVIGTLLVNNLSFLPVNKINYLFCDPKAVISKTFSNTTILDIFVLVDLTLIFVFPLFLILASYLRIISNVVRIRTSAGRRKIFSNCFSHLTVVVLYFTHPFILYILNFQEQGKIFSVIFVTVVPMLNPLVYTLKNNDIMWAVKKIFLQQKKNV